VTTKSGKVSCCGLGGAWEGKCGLVGESDFDHTWAEGIRACESNAQGVVEEAQSVQVPQKTTHFAADMDVQGKDTAHANTKCYNDVNCLTVFVALLLTALVV